MKKIILLIALITISFVNAQTAYKGKEDNKVQVGANLQEGGSGIVLSADFGVTENISFGFLTSYLLSDSVRDVDFEDRADLKARFNANIGSVLGLNKKMDVYPGLDLGLKNFGAHVGFRYFFSDGFGLYTEAGFPIAK